MGNNFVVTRKITLKEVHYSAILVVTPALLVLQILVSGLLLLKTIAIKIRTEREKTDNFTINKRVKQGDFLSATLCSLDLEDVLQSIDKTETLRNRGKQIL